jgi:hypothetical protein
MLYGAALSVVLALIVLRFALKEHRAAVLTTGALAALLMPLSWNAILRVTNNGPQPTPDMLRENADN